ncbi:putative actin interacting protein [Elsinoe australis]|uniref:Putative actin interacting protein n=1 Tax=Elsinoe australis TaxID=40998 RepID=A0A4V6DSZ2_9PEZI|nr:putative actin interacting protein [Elsinoe australis]
MASEVPQQRSSSGSGRTSGSSRSRGNPQQQLSQIEKSVTHLLVATKQLLETLTMWSRGSSTETEVSDVYVRLGYEFNIACRAFNSIGVDTNDLGPVPDLLRAILEETLSQEASQASLDKFLPRIRDIIINLLHGLKKKQSRLRQKTGQPAAGTSGTTSKDGPSSSRQVSTASTGSTDTTMTQTLDDAAQRASHSSRSFAQRHGSGEVNGPDLPPRTTSVQSQTSRSSPRRDGFSPSNSLHKPREPSRETNDSSTSSMSSSTMQNLPVVPPYPAEDSMPSQSSETSENPSPPPPAPPPKQAPMQKDALAALQRGGELERRASRRFSAYQIQKHLGSTNGVPMIPPAQHSPIPNRGRGEAQESINAVRNRGQYSVHNRNRSAYRVAESQSPVRKERKEPEPSQTVIQPDQQFKLELGSPSPLVKTPEDKLAGYFPGPNKDEPSVGQAATTPSGYPPANEAEEAPAEKAAPVDSVISAPDRVSTPPTRTPESFIPNSSPQAGKELTLFLQYKTKVKKFVLSDGADLTVARLQLAFIEKFAWNTHNNGVDLPEIYIQDSVSGVRHELEDLSDIKDRAVLVLNVEALDEVKRHIDDGMGGLKRMIEGLQTAVGEQQSAIQRVSDRQQEAAKEIAGIAAAPARPNLPTSASKTQLWSKGSVDQIGEVQALRRDLAVVRQTYTSFVQDIDASMAQIRTKASAVRTKTTDVVVPKMSSDTGRAYVNKGKKTLQEDSEKIVTSVDDLQDIVEDLRKDVVSRGVRPLARQLETVSKEISGATSKLKKLQEYLKREKPIWTKIWEKELQVVCDDRDLLTMQEELCVDLEDDLEKAAQTFALVEQATRQQHLDNPKGHGGRSASRTMIPLGLGQSADPQKAKDGVLGEVKALRPNHETRLEAIERAEKARQKELANRKGGEFQKELGSFVEEGKLKKSGGVEEVERVRKLREERARQEYANRMAARRAGVSEEEYARMNGQVNGDGAAEVGEVAAEGEKEEAKEEGEKAEGPEVEEAHKDEDKSASLEVPDATVEEGVTPDEEFVEAKEMPLTPAAE